MKEESVDKKEMGGDKPVLSNITKPPGELNLRYVLLGNIKIEIAYISGEPVAYWPVLKCIIYVRLF